MAFVQGARFTSLADFQKAKENFEKTNNVVFVIKKSDSLGKDDPDLPNIKYSRLKYECKFGGERTSKSAGIRQTSTYKNHCPANFKVKAVTANDRKLLEITEINNNHENHNADSEEFAMLPNQRHKVIVANAEMIKQTTDVKGNKRIIQAELNAKSESGVVTLKDIHNYVTKHKVFDRNTVNGFIDELQSMENSNISVFLNDDGQAEGDATQVDSILFQDEKMQNNFELYPDVLLCDATYKVNDRNMPLFVMMVIDGHGETQIAALALLKSENNRSIQNVLNAFKQKNGKHTEMKTIIVDKSAANISSFGTVFPNVAIQLCVFHAKQAFRRKVVQTNTGLTADQRQTAMDIFSKMLYDECPTNYANLCREMENIGNAVLLNYFNDNWNNCREMWAGCEVKHYRHFCNRTTNRVESFNQKLKSVIDRYSPLSKFFGETLLVVNSMNVEKDVRTFMKNARVPLSTKDEPHIAPFRKPLTAFAFSKMQSELQNVVGFNFDQIRADVGVAMNGLNAITADVNNCDCTFRNVMGLPCKHIVKMRMLKGEPLYDESLCLPRWLREYASQTTTLTRNYTMQYDVLPSRRRKMNTNQRFNASREITKEIDEAMAAKSQHHFDIYEKLLKDVCAMITEDRTNFDCLSQRNYGMYDDNINDYQMQMKL